MAMRRVTRGQNRYSPVILNTASVPKPKRQKRKETVEEAMVVANNMDWTGNFPIISGNASGLYNISTGSKEYKFVDTTYGVLNTPITLSTGTSSTFLLLNGLKLGTGAYQRIGNKIAMKSLYWSVGFALASQDSDPATDTNINNVGVRFMIVYDKQTNGALPVTGDLLSAFSGVDNNTARAIDIHSPNNLNNRDRFIVLSDKRFILQSGGPSSRYIKKYKRLNTSVAYKSGATVGDVTDITSGGLYMLAYRDSDLCGVTDPSPTVNMLADIRLRYQDD